MRFSSPSIPLVLLAWLAATACGRGGDARGADTRDPGSDAARTLAGSYRVAICKRGCEPADTARAEAWGVLVLMDSPLTLAASADDSGDVGFGSGRARRGSATPNACYGLDRPDSARTYAGITSAGETWWAVDRGGDVRVQLYRSPTASYVATLHASGGTLRGHGASRGIGAAATDWPDDSISAVRIGAADASLCIPSMRSMAPREAWGTEAKPRIEHRPDSTTPARP